MPRAAAVPPRGWTATSPGAPGAWAMRWGCGIHSTTASTRSPERRWHGAVAHLLLPVDPLPAPATGPRVGVAGEAGTAAFPWRFWIAGDPTVSAFRWGRGAGPVH